MFKRSFWEVGQWLQDTAKSVEEADKRFCDSCNKCNKQAICNEKYCPIAKTHKVKVMILELAHDTSVSVKVVINNKPKRKYKKISPSKQVKKQILSYLTRCYNATTKRSLKLVIDNASVYAELEAYEDCYYALKKGGLNLVAQRVKEINAKIKEVN